MKAEAATLTVPQAMVIRAGAIWRQLAMSWATFSRNRLAVIGLTLIALFGLMALLQPLFLGWIWATAIYHPETGFDRLIAHPSGPSLRHLLGTDSLGRDVLSQLMASAAPTFVLGVVAALTTAAVGTVVATLSAYYRGAVDAVLGQLANTLLLIPAPIFMLVIGADPDHKLGPVAFGVFYGVVAGAGSTAIVLRSHALAVMGRAFIEAARVAGAGATRVMSRHLIPHLAPLAAAHMLVAVTGAVVADGFLSFVAFSKVRLNWGAMIYSSLTFGTMIPGVTWNVFIPSALAISLFCAAFYLVSLGLREVVDPSLQADHDRSSSPALHEQADPTMSPDDLLLALTLPEWINGSDRSRANEKEPYLVSRANYLVNGWKDDFAEHPDVLAEYLSLLGLDSIDAVRGRLTRHPKIPQDVIDVRDDLLGAADFLEPGIELGQDWQAAIGSVVLPFMRLARARAEARLSATAHNDSDATWRKESCRVVMSAVPPRFVNAVTAPFVLHMHVGRVRGRFTGLSSERVFSEAVRDLTTSRKTWFAFFKKYPALARLLTVRSRFWAEGAAELVERLSNDRALLAAWLGVEDLRIEAVSSGLGDEHAGGRAVTGITASGKRFLYRPRPTAIMSALRLFLSQLLDIEGDSAEAIFLPRVLDRGIYGWVEWIEPSPCADDAEVQRYFYRLGFLTGLTWVLGSTDIHAENVLASGNRPYLVDAETILVPTFPTGEKPIVGRRLFSESPLATGLLPSPTPVGGELMDVDLSAFGSKPGQQTPIELAAWKDAGTGEMRFHPKRYMMKDPSSLPSLIEGSINQHEHHEPFIRGFREFISIVRRHTSIRTDQASLFGVFAGVPIRVLFRPTLEYGRLLQHGLHPDLMRDALVRLKHFDHLRRTAKPGVHLAGVVDDEIADLMQGDIPFMWTRSDSRDLHTSRGRVVPQFFAESAIETAQRRLDSMEDRSDWAEWVVRAALATGAMNQTPSQLHKGCCRDPEIEPAAADVLVEAAVAIGRRLTKLIQLDPATRDASWLDVVSVEGRNWHLEPATLTLYRGIPGMALLYALLAGLTHLREFEGMRDDLIQTWLRHSDLTRLNNVGAFEGLGGELFAGAILSKLVASSEIDNRLVGALDQLSVPDRLDDGFDVISGAAGAVLCLIATMDRLPKSQRKRALDAAERYGQILLESSTPQEQGRAWTTAGGVATVGFAHGTSGIALALRLLAHRLPQSVRPRYLDAARESELWQRTKFVPEDSNWLDLRPSEHGVGTRRCSTGWCNGGAGVGLARALTLGLTETTAGERRTFEIELSHALTSSWTAGLGYGQTLCHGDMAVAELFLTSGIELRKPELIAKAGRIAGMVARDVLQHGARATVGYRYLQDTPGLMNGAAGVAVGLLRVAHPRLVPSVLGLQL